MAHYAIINSDNKVVQVIVGKDEGQGTDWEQEYAKFHPGHTVKRTSYNTRGGVHSLGGTPFRKNFAGKGSIWDETRDAFYSECNYPSWIFNEETCMWNAPIDPQPSDHPTGEEFDQGWRIVWNEEDQAWEKKDLSPSA